MQPLTKIQSFLKTNQIFVWVAICLVFILGAFLYFHHEIYYPSTDDAYIQANVVNMAAQVGGPVEKAYVHDHQAVTKGQLLFVIDPAPFKLAVTAARAKLKLTGQEVAGAEDAVETAESVVAQRQAELDAIQKNSQRILILVSKGLMSKSEGDNTKSKLSVAVSALTASQSQLEQAKQELGDLGKSNAQIQAAHVALEQAKLNLDHTQITAPADGILVNFNLREGTMITAGQPLFALVETAHWWVDANFKETDLRRIHSGQHAKITIDTYPDKKFNGIVQQISAGSGAAFSLLPPENATGNWVKVTQRFPVRVDIINPDPKYPLRVGASAKVTIDTKRPKGYSR